MSEESREAIETACAIKPLVQAGLRVFFYLHRSGNADSPTNKIMLSLTAFADGARTPPAGSCIPSVDRVPQV